MDDKHYVNNVNRQPHICLWERISGCCKPVILIEPQNMAGYIPCDGILKKIIHTVGTDGEEIMEENGDLTGLGFWIYHD